MEEELSIDPLDESREYTSDEINWVDELNNWDDCKIESLNLMNKSVERRNIMLAHPHDKIEGKPQLIHQSMQTITLLRKVFKPIKNKEGEDEAYLHKWKFMDDPFDKRYDGNVIWCWTQDFFLYKVVYEKRDYFILSKKELPLQSCEMSGMTVPVGDFTEVSKSMKMRSLSRLFFLKDFEPSVKILKKEQIITFTKEREITEEKWFQFLAAHELKTYNRFPKEVELLRSAQMLSGKADGWPLHLGIVGPAGTRKSMGHIETIAWKFSEEPEIVEGANSRIKGLSPSFKEKPANIGYLAKCERMGWIDELGKMVEFETNKHNQVVRNVLGELNFLLDHKRRTVGSGNDNDCVVQAIAKFVFVTNPVSEKKNIYEHVGIIDPTTMSRIFWWIQGHDEQEFVLSSKGVVKSPPIPTQAQEPKEEDRSRKDQVSMGGTGNEGSMSKTQPLVPMEPFSVLNREEFLTLFDTCNSFLTGIDDEKVQSIHQMISQLAKEPMKSIWKPRGEHHIKLLVDGICKHRCLFIDYDPLFEVKEEDYSKAESILFKMVKNWDTDLSITKFKDYTGGKL